MKLNLRLLVLISDISDFVDIFSKALRCGMLSKLRDKRQNDELLQV